MNEEYSRSSYIAAAAVTALMICGAIYWGPIVLLGIMALLTSVYLLMVGVAKVQKSEV